MVETKRLVTVAPSELFEKGNGHFVKLRHPRYGDGNLFYICSSDSSIWEVQRHTEKYRSWFIGNSVKSDGSLYFLTPFDPLFLALQYLKKKTRFSTVDTVLEDSEFPEIKHLTDSDQLSKRLELVADVESISGFDVLRYSESKTLQWLEQKFHSVEKVLKEKEIYCHSELTSQSSNWRSDEASDPEAIKQYALGMLSEYLPDDLSEQLAQRLDIKMEVDTPVTPNESENGKGSSKKRETDENGLSEECENGPPKKRKSIAPTNDYQESFKKLVDVKKEAVASKPKLKKEQGMQSITNFFKKK